MNETIKVGVVGLLGALFLSGCLTEQEKIALEKEKREKARQELAERIKANKAAIENSYKQRVEKYWTDLAEHNYNFIQAKYAACEYSNYRSSRDKILNRYREKNEETADCLNVWVGPRLAISQDEKMSGRALLEGFGSRYMPNAYANYDKAKESAEEIQQMFNENFPEPWSIKPDNPKWRAYCKLLKGLCKARSKYLRAHDELAHYYILHKVGATTGDDLAKLDQEKVVILLLEENGNDIVFPIQKHEELDPKTCDFGTKYAPEAYAVYTKLKRDRDESIRLHNETLNDARIIDAVRFNLATVALCEKVNYITLTMDKIGADIRALYMDHKTMDKDAEAVAKTDHAIAMRWKPFVVLLPKYVYDRANGPLVPVKSPMNAFYPNTEILRWHWYALGFPVSGRNRRCNGFDKHFYFSGSIWTGDKIDTLSAADYISNDFLQLLEFKNWHGSEMLNSGRKCGFESMTEGKDLDMVSIKYWPFSKAFDLDRHYGGWNELEELERLKLRSTTQGIMVISPDVIMTRYGKYTWNDWTGAGDTVPITTPFETRLNEFNRGKCYCEVVSTQDKKNRRSEQWWKVVER